jgi:hypothetical protein
MVKIGKKTFSYTGITYKQKKAAKKHAGYFRQEDRCARVVKVKKGYKVAISDRGSRKNTYHYKSYAKGGTWVVGPQRKRRRR